MQILQSVLRYTYKERKKMSTLTNQLKKIGFTHTMNQTKDGRTFYYSLNKKKTVSKNHILETDNFRVFCLISEKEVTEEIQNFHQYNKKTVSLIKEGYTHLKYSNNKYYNLKNQSYESFKGKDSDDIDKIKVYCNQSGDDITTKSIKTLKRSSIDFGEAIAVKTKTPKDLRNENFTHKRCNNRKIYDLQGACYVNIKTALKNPNVKIYDEKSMTDITKKYQNAY